MDTIPPEGPEEDKANTFDSVLQQLAASHREELKRLRKGLEEDSDRWRTKARHLETSMARAGSNPASATISSVDVQVQTEEDDDGFFQDPDTDRPDAGVSMLMEDASKFVNVIRNSLGRADSSVAAAMEGSVQTRHTQVFLKVRKFMRKIVDWPWFDFTMGMIIFANSVFIGFQSNYSINADQYEQEIQILGILDYVFLSIYVIELSFRIIGRGREVLENHWVQFDVVLVTLGLLSAVLTAVIEVAASLGGAGKDVRDWVQNMTLLRILRLFRMVRAVRTLGKWKTMWKLVKGILNGLETMVSTFVMIIFTLFVFACFGIELISRNVDLQKDDLTQEIVKERFNSLLNIMVTLLQFVLVDGVADIYFPIITVKPWLLVYFCSLVVFLSLMLANLVTAVLVEDAISSSNMDDKMAQEHRRRVFQSLEPKFRKAFQMLDYDNDGLVLMKEFLGFDFRDLDELDQLRHHLRPEVIAELYDVLDDDDSGTITENEFINGMMQLALSDSDLELAQIKALVKQSKRSVRKIAALLDEQFCQGEQSMTLRRGYSTRTEHRQT